MTVFCDCALWLRAVQPLVPSSTLVPRLRSPARWDVCSLLDHPALDRVPRLRVGCVLTIRCGVLFTCPQARTGENVEETFLKCARKILSKIETGQLDPEKMGSGIQYGDASLRKISKPEGGKKGGCC